MSTSTGRRSVILALKISVSIVLLAFLFSRIDAARLWNSAKHASPAWLAAALALYCINVAASLWRWHVLLEAQEVRVPATTLIGSYLVALFFNNFLPSNIGGDFFRIADTAKYTKSKTVATTVILADRVMGVIALVLIAAIGATAAGALHPAAVPIWPAWLWVGFFVGAAASAPAVLVPDGFGRLLRPLSVIHPEWVGGRIDNLTQILSRFRRHPVRLAQCFGAAIFVQATMVVFYYGVIIALGATIRFADLAVIVPISFVVQMLPISVSGFGVREATFSLYFARIGQPVEGAILMSLVGQALIMIFSLSGAAVYVSRSHHGGNPTIS
ncbi:MAG TPA: lysylphosphatidylglycerol synthase transmembrane domain-containing protein [Vicinamibacterales bacterium]|nr:lysylphosphatidylglycerol synthase transmembrane domain-containing protein [Vicinamibacterales bacterium]